MNTEHAFLAAQNERWQKRNLSRIVALTVLVLALMVYVRGDVITQSISIGSTPSAIAINETTNRIYVLIEASNVLAVIDGSSDTLLDLVPTGNDPESMAIDETRNRIYVANFSSNNVTVIDGATDAVLGTVLTGPSPAGVAVDTTLNKVYVTSDVLNSGTLTVIDGGTFVRSVINLPVPASLTVAVNSVSHKVYVGFNNGYANGAMVLVINGSTGHVTPVPVEYGGTDNEILIANNKAYFASTNAVHIVDGNTDAFITDVFDSNQPMHLTVDRSSGRVYVAGWMAAHLLRIDGQTNAYSSIPTGSGIGSIAANPNTGRVYVGKCGFLCNSSNFLNLIGETGNIENILGDTAPHYVAVNSTTNKVYVANNGAGTVSVINAANATLSGQVADSAGRGVRSASVTLTPLNCGGDGSALSSSLGFYSFTNLLTGCNYTVRVTSKRFRFASQTLAVRADQQNVNFTGIE